MEIGVWFGILLSAVLSFLLGVLWTATPLVSLYCHYSDWVFIQTVILILKVKDESS